MAIRLLAIDLVFALGAWIYGIDIAILGFNLTAGILGIVAGVTVIYAIEEWYLKRITKDGEVESTLRGSILFISIAIVIIIAFLFIAGYTSIVQSQIESFLLTLFLSSFVLDSFLLLGWERRHRKTILVESLGIFRGRVFASEKTTKNPATTV